MNVRQEITDHSAEEDKPILLGLFARYHMASQWRFVARVEWHRYGNRSYESRRIWRPTEEGKVLYEHLILPNAKLSHEGDTQQPKAP